MHIWKTLSCLALVCVCSGRNEVDAQRAVRQSQGNYAAKRLILTAQELFQTHEDDRAVKMLETVIERYPKDDARFEAFLLLGKHYLDEHKELEAISHFKKLKSLYKPGETLTGENLSLYLQSLYHTGVAFYQLRQYGQAFPVLRRITNEFPNTIWANQAYYYIGRSHFALSNWNKAIDSLNYVGTFVTDEGEALEHVEAGRTFFVKIEDADLPTQHRLGKQISVKLTTGSGDSETAICHPLGEDSDVFIGSLSTEVGLARQDDKVLQVLGGDQITVEYADDNTEKGEKDVPRKAVVKVVSTATLDFTLGTYEGRAGAAFVGQHCFVAVTDVDLDSGAGQDSMKLKVVSRFIKESETEPSPTLEFGEPQEVEWQIRDEVDMTLSEFGTEQPLHSGRFTGKVMLALAAENQKANRTDQILSCRVDDEVVAIYIDELHIGGDSPREVIARIKVAGELQNRPRATQSYVSDPVLKARKHLVEGEAFLELGRIFKGMGLEAGATEKCDLGLLLIDGIVTTNVSIPSSLRERAFQVKWNLEITKGDFKSAMATCRTFNNLFPDSPYVDAALMGMGRVKFEEADYATALMFFRQVLALRTSEAKAEAQFMIAESTERSELIKVENSAEEPEVSARTITQYQLVADRYPESPYAGKALAKVVDYYANTHDYARADDMLSQVFKDYPDAQFLDQMLLKWTLVAYRMGDFSKSHEKCSRLIFEYPSSSFAEEAKKILPRIERKLKRE
ncbi:MAG: outer membrane protein assembly factor BamD [Planctomycetota bacterium]|nr:outer membrane protein assembly factor BamD [Planctomycetota bacterium]